jgi:SAM-dependent methyltransferase
MGAAADRWRAELAAWAIPPEILAQAPESPWHFPVELFAGRADAAKEEPSPSDRRALEVLPEGGSVLDVGCGAGASSLPLAGRAGSITGVDGSDGMLDAFAERAEAAGVAFTPVQGRWPAVAGRVVTADVVACHHVAYNAPDLDVFALALTAHARRRVVLELTPSHPTSNLNPLWLRFWDLERPTGPTADDAEAVLRDAGLEPERQDWTAPPGGGFSRLEDLVAFVRRRLCLPADRDAEIKGAIQEDLYAGEGGGFDFGPRRVATLWWAGSAPD